MVFESRRLQPHPSTPTKHTPTVPKGWDLSLVGACVGEQREVRVPPVLAYGEKGMKKRNIPPNSVIVYNIEVVGINGNNLPR